MSFGRLWLLVLALRPSTGTIPVLKQNHLLFICKSTCVTSSTLLVNYLQLIFSEKPPNGLCHLFWEEGEVASAGMAFWAHLSSFCVYFLFLNTRIFVVQLGFESAVSASLWLNGVSGWLTLQHRVDKLFVLQRSRFCRSKQRLLFCVLKRWLFQKKNSLCCTETVWVADAGNCSDRSN